MTLVVLGTGLPAGATQPAEIDNAKVAPGMQCTVADGWWSLDRLQPQQAEPVRVIKLQALTSAEAGVWVQPLRGPLSDHQYQIALKRLLDCKPASLIPA